MNGRAASDTKTCTDRNEKSHTLSEQNKIIFRNEAKQTTKLFSMIVARIKAFAILCNQFY